MLKNAKNENAYQVTMYMIRMMLTEGLITKQEYDTISVIFTQKYQPAFGTLFSDLPLTSFENRVIYDNRED